MNILGQPFSPWVTNQIKTRQTSLGNSTNLTDTNLLYQNTKTPWLRLASSVDITKVKGVNSNLDKLIRNTGINEAALTGNVPAKNFILQGGSSRLIGEGGVESVGFNAGLGSNKGKDLITPVYSGAYGWGGLEERGYAPMPGLVGAKVEYYKNGALSKATVKMKCFTRNQLALMDVLYMRPGYNLLLEFGWSQYLDNFGVLQTFDNFLSPALSFLFSPKAIKDPDNPGAAASPPNHFDVLNLIQSERIARVGNYEGVFGKITNYSWKFNTDGSYDCSVNLIGMGDMMESLKVNIKLPSKDDVLSPGKGLSKVGAKAGKARSDGGEIDKEQPIIANKEETTLNKLLYELYQSVGGTTNIGKKKYIHPTNQIPGSEEFGKNKDTLSEISIPSFPYVKTSIDKNGKTKTTFDNSVDLDIEAGLMAIYNTQVSNSGWDNIAPQVYITFGSLLALIQKYLLIYNKDGCPLFSFDVDFGNMGEDENYIVNTCGRFSSNPLVCLIPTKGVLGGIAGPDGKDGLIARTSMDPVLDATMDRFYPRGNKFLARLVNVYLNINSIANILSTSERDEEGSLSLLSFLNNIIKSFTKCLGGINSITIKIDEVTQQIKFIENAPQRFTTPPSTGEYARINTFGVKSNSEGSFVRNLSIDGSISPEFASMITIGAQANGNTVSSNATGFSTYNSGLIDRVVPDKLNAGSLTQTPEEKEKKAKEEVTIEELWYDQINSGDGMDGGLYNSIYEKRMWIEEDVSALTELNCQFQSLISGWLVENKHLQAPAFLPFNLSIDIEGMSGMRLYEKFLIDNTVLPPSYGNDDVDLLIKTLNHTIDTGDWLTQIDTQSTPKRQMDPNARPSTPPQTQTPKPIPTDYEVGGDSSPMLQKEDELLRLRLTRIMDDATQTLGIMEVLGEDEQTVLFTLATSELPWKGNQNSVSSIPTGRYRVRNHVSPKHGRCFWLIGNEAGGYKFNKLVGNGYTRSSVLIHRAPKAPGWLEGCIAPGLKFNDRGNQVGRQQGTGQNYLEPAKAQSQLAVNKILDKLYSVGSFKFDIVNQGGGGPDSLPPLFSQEVQNLAINKNLLPNPYV